MLDDDVVAVVAVVVPDASAPDPKVKFEIAVVCGTLLEPKFVNPGAGTGLSKGDLPATNANVKLLPFPWEGSVFGVPNTKFEVFFVLLPKLNWALEVVVQIFGVDCTIFGFCSTSDFTLCPISGFTPMTGFPVPNNDIFVSSTVL